MKNGFIFLLTVLIFHQGNGCCREVVTFGSPVINRGKILNDPRRIYLVLSHPLPDGYLLKFRAFVERPDNQDSGTVQFGVWKQLGGLVYRTEYVFNATLNSRSGIQEFIVPDVVHVENGSLFGVTFSDVPGYISHEVDAQHGGLLSTEHITDLPSVNSIIEVKNVVYFHTLSLQVDICEDNNWCVHNNLECERWCMNFDSYQCRPGYMYSNAERTCINVNECFKDNGGCSHVCTDTEGGYTCSCRPGFHLSKNNKDCEDVNECAVNTTCTTGYCINTVGNYQCLFLTQQDDTESKKDTSEEEKPSAPSDDQNAEYTHPVKGFTPAVAALTWLALITAVVVGIGIINVHYCRNRQRHLARQKRTSASSQTTSTAAEHVC